MKHLISVCVPTFNRSGQLVETLFDLSKQTYQDFEILIGDDASTDPTPEVIAGIKDPRIRYFRHEKNIGIYENWNFLLNKAKGRFLCIYHDHDIYLPTILERSIERLQDETVQFVHTALLVVDENLSPAFVDIRSFDRVTEGFKIRQELAGSLNSPIMAATAMVRRSAYEAAGLYNPNRFGLGCDKDMWFRLAALGAVGYIPEPQALIRGRVPGKGTARFSWREFELHYLMQAAQVKEVYNSDYEKMSRVLRRIERAHRKSLLKLYVRCSLMREKENIVEGAKLITKHFRFGNSVVRSLNSPGLSKVFRYLGLRLHYANIDRVARTGKKDAEAFLRSHEEIKEYIVSRSSLESRF